MVNEALEIPVSYTHLDVYKRQTLWNLFCVFLLTGVWHGASWNYILWGVINGICVLAERCAREKSFYQKIPDIVKWAATMAIVFFSWQVFYFSDFNRLEVFMKSLIGISAANAAGTVEYTYRHYLTAKLIGLSAIAVLGATTFCMPVSYTHLEKDPGRKGNEYPDDHSRPWCCRRDVYKSNRYVCRRDCGGGAD